MGFFDFLGKKPVASTQPVAASTQQPASNSQPNNQYSLPELPSFDAAAHGDLSHELPPLPSFDDHSEMSAPANFTLPEMPSFDEPAPIAAPVTKSKDKKSSSSKSNSNAVFEPASISSTPNSFSHTEPTVNSNESESDVLPSSMPAVDARTPYGPVYCDIETYRAILTNMSHAKDEVIQLQSFAENGLKLQHKTQEHYDDFHNSLSNMAKKLLLAEAKLFK